MQIYFKTKEEAQAARKKMKGPTYLHMVKVGSYVGERGRALMEETGDNTPIYSFTYDLYEPIKDENGKTIGQTFIGTDTVYHKRKPDPKGPWMVSAPYDSRMCEALVADQCDADYLKTRPMNKKA